MTIGTARMKELRQYKKAIGNRNCQAEGVKAEGFKGIWNHDRQ